LSGFFYARVKHMATTPDWDRIELDYRAGIKTLREIADEQGITHGAINKRAKRDGWVRDLSAKIRAKAPAVSEFGLDVTNGSGFIYVIYMDGPDRFYKIGMAKTLAERLKAHQCSSPYEIRVACAYYVPNMRVEERMLHDMFSGKAVRGEWFALSEEDLRQIAGRSLLGVAA
jgi:hypothetical protein